MTKISLSIAAALTAVSTLFASGAQACISCEYVPEVIAAGEKKRAAPSRQKMYVAKPTPKKRVAKIPPAPKAAKKFAVAKAPAPSKVETAKSPETTKPVETAQTEPTTPVTTEPREKPLSTAALIDAGSSVPSDEPAATTDPATSCKKFFPAVGMTLTVPCE